jgi:hypothetical protein
LNFRLDTHFCRQRQEFAHVSPTDVGHTLGLLFKLQMGGVIQSSMANPTQYHCFHLGLDLPVSQYSDSASVFIRLLKNNRGVRPAIWTPLTVLAVWLQCPEGDLVYQSEDSVQTHNGVRARQAKLRITFDFSRHCEAVGCNETEKISLL